ncbi:ATP-binding protein [Streptomyces lunaelactis]|uniref:ATP-binding protein n=1 Tax=Streptomyces lunaelactis TaxID=1535768 RepID=A0A2R4T9H6_9ACTN|nr:ATP-binding protein [Streptomyces lunaelactis]AVZ75786.1 ATP-binding protein [Streptomyces lunaelactis]NUK84664.1 ATP-binding protein [Streptomyces lunaelactis]
MPAWSTNGTARPAAVAALPPAAKDPVAGERRRPVRKLDELIVADVVLEQLRQTLTIVTHRQTLLETWNLARLVPHRTGMAVNLYGPPGTGKTLCAEVMASALERELLVVDYTALVSKYVGDTPKHIASVFRAAERTGAVLFFDEADALLTAREHSGGEAADSANLNRSVLLGELDRGGSVVVFATNRAADYDPAFVRRMIAHIEIPLPDEATRARLWERMLLDELPRAADVDPRELASRSEGLSGADIVNVIVRAAARAVQREGDERRVALADLLREVEAVREAARRIGSSWQASC